MKFTPDRDGFLTNVQEHGRGRVRTDPQEDLAAVVDEIRAACGELGVCDGEVQIRRGLHDGELFVQCTCIPKDFD